MDKDEKSIDKMSSTLEKFFSVTPDAVLVIKGQNFIECNYAAVSMLKAIDRAQILNSHPSAISPNTQPCGKASYIKANEMIELAFDNGFHRFEWIHRKFDGEDFPVEVTLVSIEIDRPEKYLLAVWRDLTIEKKTNRELIHHSKLASIGQLAAGVGHEINNPLAILDGNLERLELKLMAATGARGDFSKEITSIREASQRIGKIVDGLRVYSRIDSVEVESVSINEAVLQTVNFVYEIYRKQGVEVIAKVPAEHYHVRGLFGNLQQVVMNLLSNAKDSVEHSNKKSILIALKEVSEGWVQLTVKDNGRGIPMEIQEKVFNPFFTTKEVGKGTGLGLSFVSEHVKEMGGSLRLLSSPESGSEFIIHFPLDSKSSTDLNQALHVEVDIKTLEIEGQALVIDDEPEVGEILSDYLEDLGLNVSQTQSGEEALQLLKLNDYKYIFSDLHMPRMNGDEVFKIARPQMSADTKMFLVTGGVNLKSYSRNDDLTFVDGVIRKPFTKESVLRAIAAAYRENRRGTQTFKNPDLSL